MLMFYLIIIIMILLGLYFLRQNVEENLTTPITHNRSGNGLCAKILEKYLYLQLISDKLKKLLTFDIVGKNGFVYLDNNPKSEMNWVIEDINPTDEKQCLVQIYSYNKPRYYLTVENDKRIGVSLFGDGNQQLWQIVKIGGEPTTNPKYLIKSHHYGLYLAVSTTEYLKQETGTVYLTTEHSNDEAVWQIKGFGNQSLKTHPPSEGYSPTNSPYDFPYYPDSNVKAPTSESKWTGRNVWMPNFLVAWNNTFVSHPHNLTRKIAKKAGTFPKRHPSYYFFNEVEYRNIEERLNNLKSGLNPTSQSNHAGILRLEAELKKLQEESDAKYKFYQTQPEYLYAGMDYYRFETEKVDLPLELKVQLASAETPDDAYLNTKGTVEIDVVQKQNIQVQLPMNGIINLNGTDSRGWKTEYPTVEYKKERKQFQDVKSYGANLLQGEGIFLEMMPKMDTDQIQIKSFVKDTTDGEMKANLFTLSTTSK